MLDVVGAVPSEHILAYTSHYCAHKQQTRLVAVLQLFVHFANYQKQLSVLCCPSHQNVSLMEVKVQLQSKNKVSFVSKKPKVL